MQCQAYAAVTLWWLGYADQALQRSYEALTLAREVAHLFSLKYALFFAAWLHQFRREWQLTHEGAEALIALAAEQGCAIWGAGGTVMRGLAPAQRSHEPGAGQGQGEEGMAQIQQGLAAWGATGVKVFQPYGLTLLAEALAVVDNTEERRWEAELHRLEDEFLLVRSAEHHVEAETCFRQALDSV